MTELYHWEPNGDSLKLLIALKEESVPFESHYIDLLSLEHHGDAFKSIADHSRVPLLIDQGEALKDTQFALQYLAEAYAPRLAPEDPADWYDVQAWTAQLDQVLAPSVRMLGWHMVTLPGMSEVERTGFLARSEEIPKPQVMAGWAQVTSDAEASEDQLANARERIGQVVDRIEAALADSGWIVGDAYSVVDISAFARAHTLPRLVPELVNPERTPRVLAWLDRIGQRSAVREALAMRRSPPGDDVYAPMV
jgi:glutathione S-transferase